MLKFWRVHSKAFKYSLYLSTDPTKQALCTSQRYHKWPATPTYQNWELKKIGLNKAKIVLGWKIFPATGLAVVKLVKHDLWLSIRWRMLVNCFRWQSCPRSISAANLRKTLVRKTGIFCVFTRFSYLSWKRKKKKKTVIKQFLFCRLVKRRRTRETLWHQEWFLHNNNRLVIIDWERRIYVTSQLCSENWNGYGWYG